jgi:rhodanese-related sulfurtransferase
LKLGMQSLRVEQLQAFVGAHPGATLLDVRQPWEVELARIELAGAQALHIPMDELPARLAELNPAQPIVCICHHGVRSAQVVAFLQHQGHEQAYNLAGGVDAWSTQVDRDVPRY